MPIDYRTADDWFDKNGMKAEPDECQLLILSPDVANKIEMKLDEDAILKSGESGKALGIIIDRLT